MKKTYYEILEIDKHASSEIVKKAYTTLAKKYHPDLQEGALKQKYEEKLKLINEAYEVISNADKRKKYDEELAQEELKKQAESTRSQSDVINYENTYPAEEPYYSQSSNTQTTNTQNNSQATANTANQQQTNQTYNNNYDAYYAEQVRQAQNKAYHDAYIQDMKNRGYKIRYQKTPKDYFKSFIALCLTALILFILWQIPFIRNLFKDNLLIQAIVNLFS